MRPPRLIAPLLAVAVLAGSAAAQAPLSLPRPSQGASVTQTLGTTNLTLKYSRPGVKGRVIWGGLVPYDKPWRMGANEATQFTASSDLTVEGKPLPAGTYALLCIPTASDWTLVFSRQKEMWGAVGYDPAQDQLRVTVTPQAAEPVEWMQFTFDVTAPDAADLALRWEKLRVPVRLQVDVNGLVLKDARAAVAAAASDAWRVPWRCANWANDNNQVPDEAAAWAASALALKENFQTLSLAAKLSAKAGRSRDAVAQMTKAIQLGKADKDLSAEQIAPMEKLLADWTAKK
jgi:hypothetical protein